jgi:hypothetical protein
MTYEYLRSQIEQYFTTQWAATTPIEYENVPYVPVPGTSWVCLKIVPNFSEIAALGGSSNPKFFRYHGFVTVDIRTPQDVGTKIMMDYADTVTAIFRGVELNGILFQDMHVKKMNEEDWTRMFLSFEYQYNECA